MAKPILKLFRPSDSPIILVFDPWRRRSENGAFYRQSYYRTLIGNHIQPIEWYHFQ